VALNRSAVGTGVVAALPLVLPAAIVNAWTAGRADPNAALLVVTSLVLLLGFTFAGFAAARRSDTGTPLIHGAAGATATWAVVQALSIVVRLVRGDDLNPASMVVTALLASSAGVVGGILAGRAPNQELRT
jgi:hypothetical protein